METEVSVKPRRRRRGIIESLRDARRHPQVRVNWAPESVDERYARAVLAQGWKGEQGLVRLIVRARRDGREAGRREAAATNRKR